MGFPLTNGLKSINLYKVRLAQPNRPQKGFVYDFEWVSFPYLWHEAASISIDCGVTRQDSHTGVSRAGKNNFAKEQMLCEKAAF